jgi:hypothetical protein
VKEMDMHLTDLAWCNEVKSDREKK